MFQQILLRVEEDTGAWEFDGCSTGSAHCRLRLNTHCSGLHLVVYMWKLGLLISLTSAPTVMGLCAMFHRLSPLSKTQKIVLYKTTERCCVVVSLALCT